MGAALGLGVGVGLVLVWLSFATPLTSGAPTSRASRTRDLLDRAGLAGITVAGVWAVSAICAVLVFAAIEVVSRTVTVSLAFGLLAAYLPWALLVGRARRRQRDL